MRLPAALVDVMCCLLLLFVVIATQPRSPGEESAERALPPVDLPQLDEVASAGGTARDRVAVSIRGGGDSVMYFVEEEPADSRAAVVTMLHERATGREVVIRGDVNVPYGVVLGVVAEVSRGGFDVALGYEGSAFEAN